MSSKVFVLEVSGICSGREKCKQITLIHCRRKGKNYGGTFIPLAVGGMGHDVSDREKGKGV